jgi:hypothetical protein
MAYTIQKIDFMASRKSSYFSGDGTMTSPMSKGTSLSLPYHAKVTLLMAELCDPMSASDKPLPAFASGKTSVDGTCPK